MNINSFIFSTLFVVAFSQLSFAQTEKGRFLLGASSLFGVGGAGMSFSNIKDNDNSTLNDESQVFQFNFNPALGYFVAKNVVLGASLGFNYSKLEARTSTLSISDFAVTPFLRWYVTDHARIKPFVEANGSISRGNITFTDSSAPDFNSETPTKSSQFGIGGGAAFMLGEKASLDLFLKYTRGVSNSETILPNILFTSESTVNGLNFGVGLSFYL